MATSSLLPQNGVVLGGGAGASPVGTTAGSANQVFRVPGGGGAPAFGTIDVSQSAAVTGILQSANGGSGNAFFAVSGPATTVKTYTLPNATTTILTTNAAVTEVQGGTNQTSYVQGDLLYASAANTMARLAKSSTANQVLCNSGTSNNPAWCPALASSFGGSTATATTGIGGTTANPTLSLADQSVKSPRIFRMPVLSTNVLSVTALNPSAGADFWIDWPQASSGGPYTVSGYASVSASTNTCQVSATAGKHTFQHFIVEDDGVSLDALGCTSNDPADVPPSVIASGASPLGTSAIASTTCSTVVTAAATGVASTDAIIWTPNASIKAVTGYTPLTTGGLSITVYPTTNNVNFDVCNWTASSITPGAVTLNWRVIR
jgi:hypothetical protein